MPRSTVLWGRASTLTELMELRSVLSPSAPALTAMTRRGIPVSLAWKELRLEAAAMARTLAGLGLAHRERLVIWGEPSIGTEILRHGALRLGSGIVMLRPDDELTHVARVVAASEARLVVAPSNREREGLVDSLTAMALPLPTIVTEDEALEIAESIAFDAHDEPATCEPNDEAEVFVTVEPDSAGRRLRFTAMTHADVIRAARDLMNDLGVLDRSATFLSHLSCSSPMRRITSFCAVALGCNTFLTESVAVRHGASRLVVVTSGRHLEERLRLIEPADTKASAKGLWNLPTALRLRRLRRRLFGAPNLLLVTNARLANPSLEEHVRALGMEIHEHGELPAPVARIELAEAPHRLEPRQQLRVPISLHLPLGRIDGFSVDVSKSGLCVELPTTAAKTGDRLTVRVAIDEATSELRTGVIRWTRDIAGTMRVGIALEAF